MNAIVLDFDACQFVNQNLRVVHYFVTFHSEKVHTHTVLAYNYQAISSNIVTL